MSVVQGKKENWGSRSGRAKKKKKKVSTDDLLADLSLTDELLERIASGDPKILSSAQHLLQERQKSKAVRNSHTKVFTTEYGELFQGDCISVMNSIEDNSLDCIFADPPFNLNKNYGSEISDLLDDHRYLEWTRTWLDLCCDKLKDGGALFVYNIPKWATYIADYLNKKLNFRHWISVDIKMSMPIPKKLYPSHYALLYFIKGSKPLHFNPPRLPIKTCNNCGKEQNDYGGYKKKMNPDGVNLTDVWFDIPPVRHSKYKSRDANELHIKLLDRVIDIATDEGSTIFDPFGGSGTTYMIAELKKRKWIGAELGDCQPIIDRFENINEQREIWEKARQDINTLFTDSALKARIKSGLPIDNYRIRANQVERALGSIYLKMNPELKLEL